MIARQRDDVAAGADFGVERRQQIADRLVEPHERVLHFVAARAERVAHRVEHREADREVVDARRLSQLEFVDRRDREASEIVVRER